MQSKHNQKISQHLKDLVSKKVTNKNDNSEWLSVFLFPQNHETYIRSQPLGSHGVMNVSPPLWLGMYNSTSATIDRSNRCGWFIHLGGNQEHIN